MYSNFWALDLLVIDLIGTKAAAVPAAKTSENERSSSYLICLQGLVEFEAIIVKGEIDVQNAVRLCSRGSCRFQDSSRR